MIPAMENSRQYHRRKAAERAERIALSYGPKGPPSPYRARRTERVQLPRDGVGVSTDSKK